MGPEEHGEKARRADHETTENPDEEREASENRCEMNRIIVAAQAALHKLVVSFTELPTFARLPSSH